MKASFMPTYLVCTHNHACTYTRTHARTHTRTHATGNKTWYVQNKVGLRKKSNGPGCHVSAFVGHSLGFGLRVSDTVDVLRRCNGKRMREKSSVDNEPKVTIGRNPAVRFVCARDCLLRVWMFFFYNIQLCMQNDDDWCQQGWMVGRSKVNASVGGRLRLFRGLGHRWRVSIRGSFRPVYGP